MAVGDSSAGETGKRVEKGEEVKEGVRVATILTVATVKAEKEDQSLHCARDFICLSLYFVTSPRKG